MAQGNQAASHDRLVRISVELLRPSRWQPRMTFNPDRLWELALSIMENGIINSPMVFPVSADGRIRRSGSGSPQYELIAGERRTRAAVAVAWSRLGNIDLREVVIQLAENGFHPLPPDANYLLANGGYRILCRLLMDLDLQQLHRLAVIENMERENLTPLEEAHALRTLQRTREWSGRELARQIGRSQAFVQQRLALLKLVPEVQKQVNARIFTPTHARAISQVPLALQEAVARWAMSWAEDEGNVVGTRQMEKASTEIARFVDPKHWDPEDNVTYKPADRNHLALLCWAIQTADLESASNRLVSLREQEPLEGGNLLAKRPQAIVGELHLINAILYALHMAQRDELWLTFAGETNRRCDFCVLRGLPRPSKRISLLLSDYCARWMSSDAQTCINFIGEQDPVVLPIDWASTHAAEKIGLSVTKEPFPHLSSPADLAITLKTAEEKLLQQPEMGRQEASADSQAKVQAFFRWQERLPQRSLRHPLSHACCKCTFQLSQGDPHCYFAHKRHQESNGAEGSLLPGMMVLFSRNGTALPRCEMFRYRDLPPLYAHDGTTLVDREQVLTWIDALITRRGTCHGSRNGVFGVLSWLDYDRAIGQVTDVERLLRWLRINWEIVGGDPVIPTLIDVVIAENAACGQNQQESIVALINPVTDAEEVYAVVEFACVAGDKDWPDAQTWPRSWSRPLETVKQSRQLG